MRFLIALVLLTTAYSHRVEAASQLKGSTSPYLRLHLNDAIDWQPWSADAFEQAKREDKLIFLSIGYASCHWCHVQARTTFSDKTVISLLNKNFVNILVDSEERPDLYGHFGNILSAMGQPVGTPANFFLTADLTPLFGGGYIPPKMEGGGLGFIKLSQSIADEWTNNRDDLMKNIAATRAQLKALAEPAKVGVSLSGDDFRDIAATKWSAAFDRTYGGFGQGSKFPRFSVLSFLLNYAVRKGDRTLLKNIRTTLDHMAAGGLRDQLGGAFHRFTVDRRWQVPHFEVMLNDNALLARIYLEAYQVTGEPRYAAVARMVLDDLIRRFRLADGSFASTLDADSEGGEGAYYTWTGDEVAAVLGAKAAVPFIKAYMDQRHGLVNGRSVLRIQKDPTSLLKVEARLKDSRAKLLQARSKRKSPPRDEKILTSWNALTISAFAKAAQVLGDTGYLKVAEKIAQNIIKKPSKGGMLRHSRIDGIVGNSVFLDDYAFLTESLIDIYETGFNVDYLNRARALAKDMVERFQKEPGHPLQLTPIDNASRIPVRVVLDENDMASGNAGALAALYRLALFSADPAIENGAQAIADGLGQYFETSAASAPGLLRALSFSPAESHEVVIVGLPGAADTRLLLREVRQRFLPGTVVAFLDPQVAMNEDKWLLLASRPLIDGKATAYVCRNRVCDLPVNTPQTLASQLDKIFHFKGKLTPAKM